VREPTRSLLDQRLAEVRADPRRFGDERTVLLEALRAEESATLAREGGPRALVEPAQGAPVLGGAVRPRPPSSGWEEPSYLRELSVEERGEVREALGIAVEGAGAPAPALRFVDMRLRPALIDALAARGIEEPSAIQAQALPAALAGRDVVGIASTGSGKTLVFVLPAVLAALRAQRRAPFAPADGAAAVLLSPSHELAAQTCELVRYLCDALARDGFPLLRCVLCKGGISMPEQMRELALPSQLVVGTPGRLLDLVRSGRLSLRRCEYVALDEADRLVDLGFDEQIAGIVGSLRIAPQTLLFSATMPQRIQDFARRSLHDPLIVRVGRVGLASASIRQRVLQVAHEQRFAQLLEALQRTAPPVLVFAEAKADADDVHEFLLSKGVPAVGIHGGKDRAERERAIDMFRRGDADVLVATDVASKGLDFPQIRHVISIDMPREIENYVHRIGRTGRGGRPGLATTFVSPNTSDVTLLDLKMLLHAADQPVPPFLESVGGGALVGADIGGVVGCSFCGAFGHRILQCPKRIAAARQSMAASGGAGGE
jgi:ATP-dependent RNA helicase DDX41